MQFYIVLSSYIIHIQGFAEEIISILEYNCTHYFKQ